MPAPAVLPMTPHRKERRKRPSLSPRKRLDKPRISDPYPIPRSEESTVKPSATNQADISDDPTIDTDITFFDDAKKEFKIVTNEQKRQLLKTLREKYSGITAITPIIPFLVIEADPIPQPADQPFMIASLIACFIPDGGPFPFGIQFIGEEGQAGNVDEIARPPSCVAEDLKPFHIPTMETLRWLHQHIPDASHISFYPQQLVVELKRNDDDTFRSCLEKLPPRIGSLNVGYVNGSIWREFQARAKAPNPQVLDSTYDDTNYLLGENGVCLRPGIVVECVGNRSESGKLTGNVLSNTGVKIKKGDVERFTVALHGWDAVTKKDIYHGGNKVGTIRDSLSEDIGLVETQHSFSNTLLDINATAQRLFHSNLLQFGDYVVMDSAFTSRQRMRFLGVRSGKKRTLPGYVGPTSDHEYITIDQGIYSVRAAIINTEPQVREGVCGTPVLLAGKYKEDQSLLRDGCVAGFWTDIVGYDVAGRLYSYCQTTDELIEDGWEIAN